MRYLIIGNGPASIGAIEGIRAVDSDAEITVIGKEDIPAFSKAMIPYFLSGDKAYESLSIRDQSYYSRRRVKLVLSCEVVDIKTNDSYVLLKNGETVPYDSVLLATGADCVGINISDYGGKDFFDIFSSSQLFCLKKRLSTSRRAIVFGAGIEALCSAESLAVQGIEVTLLVSGLVLLPGLLDRTGSDILSERMKAFGVSIFFEAKIIKIVKTYDDCLKGVLLDSGVFREADLFINAASENYENKLAMSAGISTDSGIAVDRFMKTSADSVFAAGKNISQYMGLNFEFSELSFCSSYHQGMCAGKNMAGEENIYLCHKEVRTVKLFGVIICCGGFFPQSDSSRSVEAYQDEGKNIYRSIYIEEGRLKGYLLVGSVTDPGMYAALLRSEIVLDSRLLSCIREGRFDMFSLPPDIYKKMWELSPNPL